eukprot:6183592-Pleurochrysis_carterae.AAC.4
MAAYRQVRGVGGTSIIVLLASTSSTSPLSCSFLYPLALEPKQSPAASTARSDGSSIAGSTWPDAEWLLGRDSDDWGCEADHASADGCDGASRSGDSLGPVDTFPVDAPSPFAPSFAPFFAPDPSPQTRLTASSASFALYAAPEGECKSAPASM